MATGAVIAGLGLWALFTVPQRHPGDLLVPGLIYLACTAGYSLFDVPYSALPAELDASPGGRRALVAVRLGLAFVGVLIGGVSAPIIAERAGHPAMGLVTGGACAAAMGVFLLTCRLPGPRRASPAEPAVAARRPRLLSRPFSLQVGAFVLLLAAGTSSALLPFLVRDLGGGEVIGGAMLINILVALATSAVWPRLIRDLGLRPVWVLASAVTALGALAVGLSPASDSSSWRGWPWAAWACPECRSSASPASPT
jgi:GPH family glycoside/pentoside/hexuronide:cation symporter